MAMVELAARRGAEKIYLHTPSWMVRYAHHAAQRLSAAFEEKFAALGEGPRRLHHWSLLRHGHDNRWDRVEPGYDPQ